MKESLKNTEVFVTPSCLTLCDSVGCSPPGSSVHGILQARILEWVAMSSSRGSSQPRDQTFISCIYLHRQAGSFTTRAPWEAPTGMGSHFLLQGTLPTQGLNPGLPQWRQILYLGTQKSTENDSQSQWTFWEQPRTYPPPHFSSLQRCYVTSWEFSAEWKYSSKDHTEWLHGIQPWEMTWFI